MPRTAAGWHGTPGHRIITIRKIRTEGPTREVTVRKRYFATFHLGAANGWTPELDDVVAFLSGWAFAGHRAFRDADGFPDAYLEPGVHRLGDSDTLEVVRHERDHAERAVGLRTIRSAGRSSARFQAAEIILVEDRERGTLRVGVSEYGGRRGVAAGPAMKRLRRPRVVRDLVRRFGAWEDIEIVEEPRAIDVAGAPALVAFLTDPERRLPVLLCSPRNRDGRHVAAPAALADALLGLAHVYRIDDVQVTYELREALGRWLSCYDGAVRLYWPGTVSADNARRHRYWQADFIGRQGRRFPELLLKRVASASAARLPSPLLDWTMLRDAARSRAAAVDPELSSRLERARSKIDALTEALREERQRREHWQTAYTELWAEVERAGVRIDVPPHDRPQTVRAAVDWAERRFPDRLAIRLNSQSRCDDNPFQDPESVRRALVCLATTYVDARTGAAPCADLDAAFRMASGFRYSAHQSQATIGRFRNYYEADWRGRTVELEEHLKKGASHDPRHTIRIAFHYDEAERRVVIGYIGTHQRNDAT